MGSLVPGWDATLKKPKEAFEDGTFEDGEPVTLGSSYQRQLMKKYSGKVPDLGRVSSSTEQGIRIPTRVGTVKEGKGTPASQGWGSFKSGSFKEPTSPRMPNLERRSLEKQNSSLGHPVTPTAAFPDEDEENLDPAAAGQPQGQKWWNKFDSSLLNKQFEESDDEYRVGSYTPQYDVGKVASVKENPTT